MTIQVNFFGSAYSMPAVSNVNVTDQVFRGHPYVFGVDPVWMGNERELNFYNSLKMKMSIIIGVSQVRVISYRIISYPIISSYRIISHNFVVSYNR